MEKSVQCLMIREFKMKFDTGFEQNVHSRQPFIIAESQTRRNSDNHCNWCSKQYSKVSIILCSYHQERHPKMSFWDSIHKFALMIWDSVPIKATLVCLKRFSLSGFVLMQTIRRFFWKSKHQTIACYSKRLLKILQWTPRSKIVEDSTNSKI